MLLDVTAAMAVMAILILGLSATYGVALMSEQTAHYHQTASEYGQAQLDRVLDTPFDVVESTWNGTAFHVPVGDGYLKPASHSFYPRNPNDGSTIEDESQMAGHVFVTADPDGNGSTTLLEVRVVVAYKDARGEDERADFVARMSRQP